ncbi:hypothetical protein [Glaciihabitans sp. dw_435]|uniref:hypothetical protein n=1 Tax=Glaciihabitans sp. dw_435 TaxID=2720081 RepID=UPI001BD402F9|nr:hypothetical protein [Glaciihabitans sp. dw_435]
MTGSSTVRTVGDDRVTAYTWWLSLVIVPFLVAAVFLLYVLPTRTDDLFAWTIAPTLTAMFLGSAYAGGIWFFVRVLRDRLWHRVAHGFPAVVVFATLMGVATFLHWDRFHFGHISFVTWVVLYVTTPFAVAAVLVMARHKDPRTAEARDFVIPLAPRVVIAVIGIIAMVCGVVLFVVPGIAVDVWAWPLTPLTARVVGAILTLPGMVNVWLLTDARWSAFRSIFQAQIVSLVFIAGALLIARGDLDWTRPAAGGFVVGILVSLLAFVGFYVYCESRLGSPAPR